MSFSVFYIDLKQLEGEPARKVHWGQLESESSKGVELVKEEDGAGRW